MAKLESQKDQPVLAIGMDDFRKIREGKYYYIDKTRMIQDFLEYKNEVALITRPRRFGKTLNMTMLREFFDLTRNSKAIFSGLNIMNTAYAEQINTRPVIYLTFKNGTGVTINDLCVSLAQAVKEEYFRYEALFQGKADRADNHYYTFYETYEMLKEVRVLVKEDGSKKYHFDWALLQSSLTELTKAVSFFYKQKTLLLIDEYDQPLIEAHQNGFRESFSNHFYATFLGGALKGNAYLGQALLTGIQRVVKESVFSKLNHFRVYPVTSKKYAPYFGLTAGETRQLLLDYNQELDEEIKAYYDGYCFGGMSIYNPWSMLSYLDEEALKPYWLNTSTNGLIKEAITKASRDFQDNFEKLILNEEVRVSANLETAFVELATPQTLWGLLINAGYLTISKIFPSGATLLKIPNEEVKKEFREIVALYTRLDSNQLNDLFNALIDQDMEEFLRLYQSLVYHYVSVHDIRKSKVDDVKHLENSYHMLFLGMAISVSGMYEITSNLEAGDGRADVIMKSLQPKKRPHILVEFKQGENVNQLKQVALNQIFEKKYYAKLTGHVLCVGIAHHQKKCELMYQEMTV